MLWNEKIRVRRANKEKVEETIIITEEELEEAETEGRASNWLTNW